MDDLLTEVEAATWLRISPRTLQDWRLNDTGPAYIFLGRRRGLRYRRVDLEAWLRDRTVEPKVIAQ